MCPQGKDMNISSEELSERLKYLDKAIHELHDNGYFVVSDLADIVCLYCFDAHQEFYDFSVGINETEVTLGRVGNFTILYDNPNIASPEFRIVKQNNYWIFEDTSMDYTGIYVNDRRTQKCILNLDQRWISFVVT